MKFDIKGVHYDIGENTREFITNKLEKVSYAAEHVMDLSFTLTKQLKDWKAEVKLNLRWGIPIYMEEVAYNLHEALEKLIDKLDVKISKEKDKIQDHHHEKIRPEPMEG